ncbi:MAG: T9SS type A sorting domain-containing protein [Crocinitomicaceae bacterium]|nr:T9SS type A sorting domain-containing protein [Crocinitomicaceae bacterium]
MKKIILGLFSLSAFSLMAQTYTVNDTLSAGQSQLYWTADSNAVNMDAVNGAGVTWDYSTLQGYDGISNPDTVKNAVDSPDYGDYPDAIFHDDLSDGASVYFTNYVDSVMCYGYVFTIDGNTVKIMHDVDPLKLMNLPMNLNDSFTDSTYGNADVYGSAATTAGDANVIADGTGTLNLGATTFTNVIRIKLVETIETTVTLPPPINTVSGTVTRTVYSYYDLANQKLPVFIHATIDVASSLFNGGYTAVYSSVQLPPLNAGIGDEAIETLEVYPNPATDVVSITSDMADELVIMNAVGQVIQTITKPQSIEQVDVSKFETGIYFIQVKKGNATKTRKLIIR